MQKTENIPAVTPGRITQYVRYLEEQERAMATVRKYARDLDALAQWLDGRTLTKSVLVQWKEHLAKTCAPATVNAKLSAVNGLLRFLGRADCRVKFLRLQHRAFRDAARELSREEYLRLVQAARRDSRGWTSLVMEAICSTGIRVSEVRYLTVEAARAGRAEVALKGKIRTILLPGKLCRKLLKYAQKTKNASGAIFRTKDGDNLSRFQIWKAMKKLCKAADVAPSKVFPHNLRHLFATTFYRATKDIVRLADVLGHSSVNTTRIYLLTTSAEHARWLDKLNLIS